MNLILLCYWQDKEEGRSVVEFALSANGAAVRQHDVFRDRKPQAGAAALPRTGLVYAIKALEKAGQVLR